MEVRPPVYHLSVIIDGPRTQPIPIPPYPSWGDLEYILGIFGKQRFETRFGFVYLDEKTQPKDIAPNGSLSGVALLFTEDISQSDTLPNLIPEYILRCVRFRLACKRI